MNCGEVKERLAAFLFEAVDDEETEEIRAHLDSGCPRCTKALEVVQKKLNLVACWFQRDQDASLGEKILRRAQSKAMLLRALALLPLVAILVAVLLIAVRIAHFRLERRFIARLEKALFLYRLDHGSFPPTPGEPLPRYLASGGAAGPYIDLSRERIDQGRFVDRWNTPYQYVYPGVRNKGLFDLLSFGPNGRNEQGWGDDISNWQDRRKP